MKNLLVLFALVITLAGSQFAVYPQDLGSINFIDDTSSKKAASFGDAVRLYVLILGRNSEGFRADFKKLETQGLTRGIDSLEKAPLRRGEIALMIARHLNLKRSLLYRIIGTKRYATRACVASDIMTSDSSERDILSGAELVEIMTIVSNKMGKQK